MSIRDKHYDKLFAEQEQDEARSRSDKCIAVLDRGKDAASLLGDRLLSN